MPETRPLPKLIVVTLALGGLAVAATARETSVATPEPQAAEKPPATARAEPERPARERGAATRAAAERAGQQRGAEAVVAGAWWNDPGMIEALRLEPRQRSRMDLRLTRFVEGRAKRMEAVQAARTPFDAALEKGDLEAARRAVPALEAAEAAQAREVALLRLDVIALLNEEQRVALGAGHGELLRQDWGAVRSAARERSGRPRRGASGQPAAEPGGDG